jgi:SWI/SNF-related matrix-associated actin-dependent regulator 1 of chromatin subfamily A
VSIFDRYKNLLDYDGHVFRAFGLDDDTIVKVEKIGGIKRPTKSEPCWRVPALPLHVQHLSAIKLTWTAQAAERGRYLIAEAADRVRLSKATESSLDFQGFGLELHPYQKAGVEYMLRAKRVLLADEMGLGKTSQALALLHKGAAVYPALIICPASLKYWWKQEGERCLPGKVFVVLDSKFKPLSIAMADVCIVNYDLLAAGWETPEKKNVNLTPLAEALMAHPFETIIFDEMHACKNGQAQRTKAVKKLAQGRTYRIGITGTPVTNRPSELAPLLAILDRLQDMGGYSYFMKRYCSSPKNKFNPNAGAHNLLELNERMRSSFYLRRTKKDVRLELPPFSRNIVPVPIDNRKEYQYAEDQLIAWVREKAEEKARNDDKFQQAIKGLSEIEREAAIQEHANDKAARAMRAEAMIRIGALRDIAARGKLKAALQWLDDFIESGEKIVVSAVHQNIIEALRKRYPDAVCVTSDMSPQERQMSVSLFQSNPEIQMLIGAMGTSAGSSPIGTGHTLTAASNCLTLELPWTDAHMRQWEGRIYRMGQDEPTMNHIIVGQETIEHDILGLIDSKGLICGQTTDGAAHEESAPLLDILMAKLAA